MVVSCLFSFAQDINLYSPELIHRFEFGNGENQLGAGSAAGGAVGTPGQLNFTEDFIYLNDYVNSRFIFYDYNLNVQNIIEFTPQSSDIQYVSVIRVDEQGNLYGGIVDRFHKVNSEGEEIYTFYESRLSERMMNSNEYWLYGEYVLFYSDSGRPMAIDPEGTILETNEIQQILQEMKEQNPYWQDERYKEQIDELLEENNLMLREDILLTFDLEMYMQYWNIIGGYDHTGRFETPSHGLIDFDSELNSLWGLRDAETGEGAWYIFSETGEVLDFFRQDPPHIGYPRLGMDGNVYFRVLNQANETYDIYMLEPQW
ncbi:MAG: hypothetical protein ACLFR1_13475 [Spirochaetia bacterium]